MRKLILEIRDFWKEDFHWATYLGTGLFLALAIFFNYNFGLADRWLYPVRPDGWQFLRFVAFFGLPYGFVLAWQGLLGRYRDANFDLKMWIAMALAILAVAFTAWFPWHTALAKLFFSAEHFKWGNKLLWCLKRLPFSVLPILLYWGCMEREKFGCYGLWGGKLDFRPYLWTLLSVLPVIIAVSFLPDFQRAYPFFMPASTETAATLWWKIGLFELSYGSTFVVVEWVFRGFLVIGLAKWLGPRTVLPIGLPK